MLTLPGKLRIINWNYYTQNLLNILDNKNDDLSDMALVLKDSILSVFEEYADSVENAEKIAVLKELIKGLL